MRPNPIIWFERITLPAFALGVLSTGLYWRDFIGPVRTFQQVVLFWTVQGFYFGIYLLLIWLIARRGNAIARWTYAAAILAAVVLFFLGLPPPPEESTARLAMAGAQCALTLTGLGLIFGPDTGPWFRGRSMPVDPEIFR